MSSATGGQASSSSAYSKLLHIPCVCYPYIVGITPPPPLAGAEHQRGRMMTFTDELI